MKKNFLLILFAMCLASPTWAQTTSFTYSGITYNIVDADAKTVEVGSNYSLSGTITIPEEVEYESEKYTVVGIAGNAFSDGSSYDSSSTTVTMPNTVTYIGYEAFFRRTGLTSINLSTGLTSIGSKAFQGDSSLACDLIIPDGVTEIPQDAFHTNKCPTIIIGNGVTTIGQQAFYESTAATELTIGSSVISIGNQAFASCTALTSITSLNPTPPSCYNNSTNEFSSYTATLYVPSGSYDAYHEASVWSSFTNIEELSPTSISIDITEAGYATYYTDVEYEMPEGLTGTTVTGITKDSADDGIDYVLTMNWEYGEGDIVPANTALVLQGAEDTYECEITSTGAEAPADNLLMGSTTAVTTYGPVETGSYLYYELSVGTYGVGFYYGAEGGVAFDSGANKAWLPLSETQVTNARFLGFGKGDDTTGISSIESASEKAVSGIYTIQGVRVANTNQPGLYIVDGKKVLVK